MSHPTIVRKAIVLPSFAILVSVISAIFISIHIAYALIALTVVLSGIVVIRWPNALLYTFFIVVPLEQLVVVPGNTLSKIIGGVLAGSVLIRWLVKNELPHFPRKAIWIVLFVIAAFTSLIFSSSIERSLSFIPTLLLSVGLYFVLYFGIDSSEVLFKSLSALLVGGALSIVAGFLGYGSTVMANYNVQFVRMGGLVGDPNEFALLITIMANITVARLLFMSAKQKYIYFSLLALFVSAVISSYSRTGLVALLTSVSMLLTYFILSQDQISLRRRILLVGVLLALGLSIRDLLPDKYLLYLDYTLEDPLSVGNISNRLYAARVGIREFLAHPLAGIGLRNYNLTNSWQEVAHNMYIETAVSMGLLGLIPFLSICILSISDVLPFCTRRWQSRVNRHTKSIALGVIGSLATLLIIGLALSIELEKYTWMVFGLTSVTHKLLSRESQTGPA